MTEKFEKIYTMYKNYIIKNSKYSPEVTKYSIDTSSYFPTISCNCNFTNTDYCSNDKRESFNAFYFTINIYTKDKTINSIKTSSQVINNELTELTNKFFGEMLNMKLTLCNPAPNLDKSILRKLINFQCMIGNARGNIIRR